MKPKEAHMEQDKISRTQLMALLWAGAMAPAAELFPGLLLPGAGRGAWLAVVLAVPVVLAAGWLLGSLAGREGLARGITQRLGKWAGGGILILYIVWAELLLALRLRLCAQRLFSTGERDGALAFFLLSMVAVLLWMGRGKLAAFARAGQLFLAALLTAAGVVLLLSIPQTRLERLFPLWWSEAGPALQAVLSAAGVMGWGLFLPFMMGAVADQGEKKNWHWLFWGLGGMLLLGLAQGVILGNLGVGLAGRVENPYFILAKNVGVEGAFQRAEGVIAAVWTFADLTMGGILVFAVRAMASELLPDLNRRWVPWAVVVLAAGGALYLFPALGTAELWNARVIPAGNLVLGAVLPLVLLAVGGLRGKDHISCGKKSG